MSEMCNTLEVLSCLGLRKKDGNISITNFRINRLVPFVMYVYVRNIVIKTRYFLLEFNFVDNCVCFILFYSILFYDWSIFIVSLTPLLSSSGISHWQPIYRHPCPWLIKVVNLCYHLSSPLILNSSFRMLLTKTNDWFHIDFPIEYSTTKWLILIS